ncbi:TPA: hypothetical protein ACH3X2_008996 [Trebouxia sp. C0005]
MQEVPMAACDLQQLEEALTLAAASRPAAPIKADDSPALQQPALHEGELTALPADVQSVSIHLLHQGAASPAEAPAGGQSEGSLALQQAPAPDTKVDSQEVPAKEAVPSGGACSKQQQDSTASLVSDAKRDGISIQAGPVPSSPVEAHNSPQGVKEAARPAVPATRSQAEAATSSPVKAPSSPQSLQERDSPVSPMKEMSFAGAADTLAGARATMVTPVTTESTHPELTDKAAAEATAGVPPANVCASQPVTPATTESTHPELTDRAAAQAATGVPPAVADASLDSKEEEAGHAAEAHAAGAAQGKGSATQPSATMSEAEPKASAEDMAAPNSSSALSEANVEPSTHAAKGFTDNRTAADSPEADIRAKAVPNGPAEEFSVGDTIAAKHAAGSAFTTPKTSASSSPAQTKPERQAAKSKVAAQTASSAAAAAASPPIARAQSDINSAPASTAAAAATKGSANVDAAGAAVSNPAAARVAGPASSLSIVPAVDQAAAKPAAALPAVGPAAARPAAALPVTNPAAADAAVPGSSLCTVPTVDQAAAKPATLPAVGPAAARPAVDMPAVDPAAAKPAVSNATATDAADAAPASGGYAAAAAPRSAQIGRELKTVNESSEGLSEGEYEVVPGADYLEQLKDPHKRRLSDGATAVVNLARVRSMADLAQLQAPPYLGPLQPGQQVVIKVVKGIDRENLRDLAEHEEEVLRALTGKPYVPQFFASFRTEDVEEGSGVVRPCANLIMGLVEGWDLQTILKAVQKKVRKLKTGSSKLLKLKAWVWHFSMHLAHALAQVCTSMVFCLKLFCLLLSYDEHWLIRTAMYRSICCNAPLYMLSSSSLS